MVWRRRHRDFLGHVVLHAAVSAAADLPFPAQLEVAERLAGHEVAAGGRLAIGHSGHLAARNLPDGTVLDLPVRGWNAVIAKAAPTRERLAIEDHAPPGGALR